MNAPSRDIRWSVIVMVIVAVAAMAAVTQQRLRLDTDITKGLPHDDPVLADAQYIVKHYPVFERIVVDVGLDAEKPDQDLLSDAATMLEQRLNESGLFHQMGTGEVSQAFPRLISQISQNLPVLFNSRELNGQVEPLLTPDAVREALQQDLELLAGLEGIGQAEVVAADPLALRNTVLSRFVELLPASGVTYYKGRIFSQDGLHVLIIAEPKSAATESGFAHQVKAQFQDLSERIDGELGRDGAHIVITPVGAFRAAVDNETIIRRDTNRAVLIATIGIALLLLVSFPRGLIGLLALAPAVAGTVCALFTLSLIRDSISILAVGFGGAIISITVDTGIAFFLFLDRTSAITGKQASHEIRLPGLTAGLTTAGAFLALTFSGFEILAEVGMFAALGVMYSYLFIHLVLPRIFISMPAARRSSLIPLERIASGLVYRTGWVAFGAAVLFGGVMALIARPVFRADLNAMNTVSPETLAAEQLIKDTWGDVFANAYLFLESDSLQGLQDKADRLAGLLAEQREQGALQAGFSLSQIFPGQDLAQSNLRDWREFWNPTRKQDLRAAIGQASRDSGFMSSAFDGFFAAIESTQEYKPAIPEELYPLLGISHEAGSGSWTMLVTLKPGPGYNAEKLYEQIRDLDLGRMLDAKLFSQHLSVLLRSAYLRMVAISGTGLLLILLLLFLDIRLMIAAILPVCFSIACTLGTLTLLGLPLDVPGLFLAIIVIGMGEDYAVHFICAHQRHFSERHPLMGPVRTTVLLCAVSTMIGLGSLAGSEHALLHSAGLASVLGIGYALLGTYLLLPSLLRLMFAEPGPMNAEAVEPGSTRHRALVLRRYRHLPAYVRIFARFKMLLDPMFPRLAQMVRPQAAICDVGCGFGVPGCWLNLI